METQIERGIMEEALKPKPSPGMLPLAKPDGSPSLYGVPYDGKRLIGGPMPIDGTRPLAAAPKPPAYRVVEVEISAGRKAPFIFDPATGNLKPADIEGSNASGGPAVPAGNAIQSLLNARQR
jgi:hypothetical protein